MSNIEIRTRRHEAPSRQRVGGIIAAVIAGTIIACAVFPGALAPYDPLSVHPTQAFSSPNWEHPFGTDESGRDVLSRAIYGARTSLLIGAAAMSLGLALGTLLGFTSGLMGRIASAVGGRVIELFFAFPGLLLALIVITVVGPGPISVIVAVGLSTAPGYARILLGQAQRVRRSGYVSAAVVLGHRPLRIFTRTIAPNTLAPLTVIATLGIGQAVVWAASLSYLGLGTQPPSPEWGAMLNAGRIYVQTAPWLTIMPGLMILATTMSFTVIGRTLARRTGSEI